MNNINVLNINRKIYLQNFQENLYFTEYSNKKILKIKRYVYDTNFCVRRKNLNNIKNIINHNDIMVLNQLISLISSKYNNINEKDVNGVMDNHIIVAPHYAFMTIERKWQNDNNLITSHLPQSLHPELLIRVMSMEMQDITIIDFFRRWLHLIAFKSCYLNETLQNCYEKSIKIILYDLWAKQFDFFINKEFVNLYHNFNFIYNEKNSFHRKIKLVMFTMNKNLENRTYKTLLHNNPYELGTETLLLQSSNYLRYGNQWITSFQSDIWLISIFIYRCINFWKYRMGLLVKQSKFSCINLNQRNCHFLGSILRKIKKTNFLTISLYNKRRFLSKTFIEQESLAIKIPLVNIIGILSKYGLCDQNGYPISKSSWSTWSDFKIIGRFTHLFASIYIYYNGCINRNKISHIQYILSYSCAKTLACKHKTNLRSIWYQYKKDFHQNCLFNVKQTILKKNINDTHQNLDERKTKTWNLNYTEYDPIIALIVQ